MKRSNPEGGFTLLEVMIALTIAGLALTTLLALGVRTIQTGDRVERVTQEVLLAQRLMAEIESGAIPLPDQGETGAFQPPAEGYRWRAAFESTPLEGLQLLSLTVYWEGEAPESGVTLDSYVQQ